MNDALIRLQMVRKIYAEELERAAWDHRDSKSWNKTCLNGERVSDEELAVLAVIEDIAQEALDLIEDQIDRIENPQEYAA